MCAQSELGETLEKGRHALMKSAELGGTRVGCEVKFCWWACVDG